MLAVSAPAQAPAVGAQQGPTTVLTAPAPGGATAPIPVSAFS